MNIIINKDDPVDNPVTDLGMHTSDEHKVVNTASKQRNISREKPDLNGNPPKEPTNSDLNGIRGFSSTYDLNGVAINIDIDFRKLNVV